MQVWCSFEFFQRSAAETMPAMVSNGRITTDILLCRALHQSGSGDKCRDRRRLIRQAYIGGGGYTVPCGQAQDACGRFLPETAQTRFRRGTGMAAAAVASGSFGFGRDTRTAAAAGAADGGGCFDL
jgi:hypothetical protein